MLHSFVLNYVTFAQVLFKKTFRAGEKVEKAHIENRRMQYLYASGEAHVFMDNGTYEQIELGEKQIERELKF